MDLNLMALMVKRRALRDGAASLIGMAPWPFANRAFR
jgi:hypothetical protein